MTDLAPYYRRRAGECRQKAAAIFYERDKADWLRLAEHWLRLSEQVDDDETRVRLLRHHLMGESSRPRT